MPTCCVKADKAAVRAAALSSAFIPVHFSRTVPEGNDHRALLELQK
jgi:hypothetical protein